MNYFVTNSQRKNTVCHEFQKGHFDGKTFRKEDSVFLHDDILFLKGIEDVFRNVIPDYSDTGESEITPELWNVIMSESEKTGGETLGIIQEADRWVQDTFREYECFTIIGI